MDTSAIAFPSGETQQPLSEAPEAGAYDVQRPLSGEETLSLYKAMQEERDKRQELERQLTKLRLTEPSADKPAGELISLQVYANHLRVSRRFAEQEYGCELITSVHDWAAAKCDADPTFNQQMRSSDDPYQAAKIAYDQEVGGRQSLLTAITPQPLPNLPRSLADAPGNGAAGRTHVPVGDGNAYQSLFR